MKKFALALSLAAIPITAHADGIVVQEYTLRQVPYVLLVQLLLADPKRHHARVRVLNVFAVQPAVAKGKALPSPDQEIDVPLHSLPEPVPQAWVEDLRYWDLANEILPKRRYFLIFNREDYEVTDYTDAKLEKFKLFTNPALRKQKLANATETELVGLFPDRDYLLESLAELRSRKAAMAEIVLSISDDGLLRRTAAAFFSSLPPEEREGFLEDCLRVLGSQFAARRAVFRILLDDISAVEHWKARLDALPSKAP
jgi:hypothetical protein